MTAHDKNAVIRLAHGAGGRAMRELIGAVFASDGSGAVPGGIGLPQLDDGAAIPIGNRWLILTTDSHVIHPIEFPGCDIGRLAVCGTVNDLAMMGGTQVLAMTCAIIVEEGFPVATLKRIRASMLAASQQAGAPIVTGDTKVMGRGEIDGIAINTTGVALVDRVVGDADLQPGDRILLTGTVGDHGFAVLAARGSLGFEGDLASDVAPLNSLVSVALGFGGAGVVAMKDPTRGGLASTLNEMAEKGGVSIELDEAAIPIRPAVRAASELLGIDPLHVANEGKAVLVVRPGVADAVLEAVRAHPLGRHAALIGRVTDGHPGRVAISTGFGRRLLVELDGDPIPRIC